MTKAEAVVDELADLCPLCHLPRHPDMATDYCMRCENRRVFVAGRVGGKTTWLIAQARKDPKAVIVCADMHTALDITKRYGIRATTAQGLTLSAFHGANLYVDNVDVILQRHLGMAIGAVTLTGVVEP